MYKLTKYVLGIFFMALGIALVLKAGLGADPFSIAITGISVFFDLSFGRATQILLLVLVIIVLLLDYTRIGLGTLGHAILSGFFVDILIGFITDVESMKVLVIPGIMFMSFGIALYITSEGGEGALDALMFALVKKFHMQVHHIRILLDCISVSLGVALGATIGIGTLIMVLLTGPLIAMNLRLINKYENIGI